MRKNICKSDKDLVSTIHEELLKLNNKKTKDPIKMWAKDLNKHLSKDDIQMVSKHLKRCSTLLVIGKPHQDGYNKKDKITSVGQEVKKIEPSYIAGWIIK